MTSLFSTKPPPLPPLPPPPPPPIPVPTPQDPMVTKGRKRDRQVAALATGGRSSTVLTGGLGLTGDSKSSKQKTALGA